MKKNLKRSFMNKNHLSICLIVLLFFFPCLAQSKVIYIPPEVFSFQGVPDLTSPVKMELKDNQVDFSAVIRSLNRVKGSYYFDSIQQFSLAVIEVSSKARELCKQSKNQKCMEEAYLNIGNFWNMTKEISGRIFYPYWYNEKKQAQEFTEAMNFLDSKCESCFSLAVSIHIAPREEYNQLYDKIKNTSKQCIKDILNSLTEEFANKRIPEKCLQEENKNQFVCKKMLGQIKRAKKRFLDLTKLLYGKTELTDTEAQSVCLECSFLTGNEMRKIMEMLEMKTQCSELDVGEEKKLIGPVDSARYYTIKKEADGGGGISTAPLTLKFVPAKDYDGPVSRDKVHEHYMNRVKKCIAKANTKMLGPNGEKIRIIINNPSGTDSCSKENVRKISIRSKNFVDSALDYSSKISCPVITHEILHLLGLCDEYRRQDNGYHVNSETGKRTQISSMGKKKYKYRKGFNFDCRVTQLNSIMAYTKVRWDNVFKTGKDKSLLDPGHFYSILYGNCPNKNNKNFNRCAKLAYKESIEDKKCLKEKQWCESQNVLGRNKQQEIDLIKEAINMAKKNKLRAKVDELEQKLQAVNFWPDEIEKSNHYD